MSTCAECRAELCAAGAAAAAAGMIARNLDLMRGGNQRYQKTAAYGHFGRDDAGGLHNTWGTACVWVRVWGCV